MKFHYECFECKSTYEISPAHMLCPICSKLQKKNEPLRGILEVKCIGSTQKNFSVFDFLPVEKEFFPAIPVGNSPLWEPTSIRKTTGFHELYFKNDSSNPTCSFKDRASFLVAAFAKKHGIKEIVAASTGNAGSSMAGIGAAAGIRVTLFIPKSAPQGKLVQSLQYGANLILVDGSYDDAYRLSMEYYKIHGGLNRNTAFNPLTIEGKKTVSLEIFKQLGDKIPDHVFVPTGDGVIIAGVYKGFRDLMEAGLTTKVPKIYAVQAEGSSALAKAFAHPQNIFPTEKTSTVADSICVDVPCNGYHALWNMKKYGGDCVVVTDQAILEAQQFLSANAGAFVEPAAATAYAGFDKIRSEINPQEKVVILLTGNGLKDVVSAQKIVKFPSKAIKTLDEVKE